MLSEKATKIMALLMNNDQSPLTIRRIAFMLELSQRSISTYLKEVYLFCKERQIQIVNKPGMGIRLDAGNQKEAVTRELQIGQTPYYTGEYRVNYIISLLLNNWTSYTIALFADDLCVSKSTVEGDLREAEIFFSSYRIQLQKKAGAGLFVHGAEPDIRRAAVAINRRFFRPAAELLKPPPDYRLSEETMRRLLGAYRGCDVASYAALISKMDRKGLRPLSDRGFEAMLEYFMVAHKRMTAGHILAPGYFSDNPHDRPNMEDCICVLDEALHLPPGERDYAELLLCCMEYQPNARRMEELFEHPLPPILAFTHRVIRYIARLVGLDFSQDALLLKTLYYYHRSALLRIEYGIEMPNPFLEDVKKTYPAIFSACFAASSIYEKAVGQKPSENEISYLSLLVGGAVVRSDKKLTAVVVCAAGIGTSQILARKIEDRLPQISVLGTLAFGQLRELQQLNPQIVISTIANFRCPFPTVTISPVLSEEDMRKLNHACAAVFTKGNPQNLPESATLLDLLREELLFPDYEGQSKEKVLHFMAEALMRGGYVEEDFYRDVLAREQIGSTALGAGVAIPHGITGLVKKPAICLLRLKQSIDWGGEGVNLIFMLALNFEDVESTKLFFQSFYRLTTDGRTVSLLKSAQTKEEIQQIILESCL